MLLNPLSERDSFGIDEAEEVAKSWWIFLVGGIVSLVFGALILAVDWGVDSLAAFIGVLFIIALPFGFMVARHAPGKYTPIEASKTSIEFE